MGGENTTTITRLSSIAIRLTCAAVHRSLPFTLSLSFASFTLSYSTCVNFFQATTTLSRKCVWRVCANSFWYCCWLAIGVVCIAPTINTHLKYNIVLCPLMTAKIVLSSCLDYLLSLIQDSLTNCLAFSWTKCELELNVLL